MSVARPYELFSSRNFRAYFLSRLLVNLSSQIQLVVVAWQIYLITRDPLSLGMVGLAEVVPAIGFSLLSGHVVDLFDHRRVALGALYLQALSTLLLLVLTLLPAGVVPRHSWLGLIYGAIFLTGTSRAFYSPASFALLADILPKERYAQGTNWSSSSGQLASALGPALGGLLFGFIGLQNTYGVAFLLALWGLSWQFVLRPDMLPKSAKPARESLRRSLTLGLRFVFGNRLILSALSLDLFAVLFGGAVALLPIFAGDILHVGAQGLGLLRAAPSLGALAMSFFLAHRGRLPRAGLTLLSAIAGFGLCMIGFALSRNFYLSAAILALSGALDNISVVVRQTILQLLTPAHLRGRVAAVNTIFVGSSNEIGDVESGLTAKWMGTVPAVVFGGCMTLLVVLFTYVFLPEMRRLELSEL